MELVFVVLPFFLLTVIGNDAPSLGQWSDSEDIIRGASYYVNSVAKQRVDSTSNRSNSWVESSSIRVFSKARICMFVGHKHVAKEDLLFRAAMLVGWKFPISLLCHYSAPLHIKKAWTMAQEPRRWRAPRGSWCTQSDWTVLWSCSHVGMAIHATSCTREATVEDSSKYLSNWDVHWENVLQHRSERIIGRSSPSVVQDIDCSSNLCLSAALQ